ncbi:disease resistance protein RUN1-like [Prosopis cineraria]|uniref:disease resistance protein RUN1-like n=1 Tax=Prosopis cineraria TaxID=364024 RepID=UPI00240EED28|nr:disease resistance protein RUN1-like [Prosopis cineraria]
MLKASLSNRYDRRIREITHSIKILLDATYLDIPPHLVRIQHRVKKALHLSKYYSKDIAVREENVIIVGICGVVGIGKSTIARIIYDTISGNFESSSFLASINKVWKKDNGQILLQEQLISEISSTKVENIHDTETGIRQIKMALQNRRSLVVLDDVDHIDQLVTLCGSREWFGFGSMILITSTSKHILDHIKVKYVYEVRKMDKRESLELLSWHAFKLSWNAFKQSSPSNDFINLAKNVILHCEGLPLVLEVVGSLLYRKTTQEWECVLKKLKSIPASQIQEKIKISCQYLDDSVKDLFFTIAYFYVGDEKLSIAQKLSGLQFPLEIGINTLVERSLIKIDMNNRLHMHELLQEIGKGINPNKPKPKYNYHVFLSFCGDDTRKSFATHLHDALKRVGLEVFMDPEIRRGDNISSSLVQAIESSRISIIIFSIKYASSSWCLQELEKIMECHRTVGQQVLPIFFSVQPSDVRKQSGDFGSEFKRLLKRTSASKDQKFNWTRALNEVANLAGWDYSHRYGTEAELINCVMDTVTKNLDDNTNLFVTHHPVGLRSRMKEIIQMLSDKSDEIMVVGILGMGGIGKTTLAKAIYNEVGQYFEAKSFLANIREASELENGLVRLQEQLLSNILQSRRLTLYCIESGKAIMKERLCGKKALIVLDSVTNMAQLDALCGNREWFGSGSKIIITTRDQRVLDSIKADNVYKMKEMDGNESLELFSWHAFKQASPTGVLIDRSRSVIAYCEGLPLALEVLGAYLFDRPIEAWKCVLDSLKEIPNDQIHKKLRISFDGLSNDFEKNIFLDICCFFIGKDRNYATQILDGCGLHAEIGITRLIELSLLRVDKNNKLDMHGLIRDMGREIVREESPDEPGNRSRLWIRDNGIDVLRNCRGTISVKGLALNFSRTETQSFDAKGFEMMKRLRLLQLGHVKLNGNYEYLSKELRWLCWHGFPSCCMPQNFSQEKAVVIDLRYSYLTQVLKNCQLLERLKVLNLSHSYDLRETPDFSRLPNLERLILKDCPRLSSIHESIGDLKFLILANLKGCKDLGELPRGIYNLKSLKTLNLSGCSKLEKLEDGINQMESLTTLMANETSIAQVPLALVRSRSITYLSICGHEGLPRDVFPILIRSWVSPRNNSRSLQHVFASMPFLLPHLFRSLSHLSSGILRRRPYPLHISGATALTSIGFHDQVDTIETANFLNSFITVQVGGFSEVIDALLKIISQGWSDRGLDYYLPGDNYSDWLAFEDKGSSVSFKVTQVVSRSLKGMVICSFFSSLQNSTASVYPVGFMIKNFTKASIDFYKRDSETSTSDEEERQKILSNLEPENEVEVRVDFAHKYIVNKTIVYLVYSDHDDAAAGKRVVE